MQPIFKRPLKFILIGLLAIAIFCPQTFALEPNEVLVIANKNMGKSIRLAQFYMDKRQIPKKNLVLLSITTKETCSRKEYETKAIPPIRKFLHKNKNIRVIVTMFGVPLKIVPPQNIPEEIETLRQYKLQKKAMEAQLTHHETAKSKAPPGKLTQLSNLKKTITEYLRRIDKTASFDSELMLIKKKKYDLNMWIPNPYYLGFRDKKTVLSQSDVLMTSRLDGANETIVKRIINDSIEAEKTGLKGKAYFDARWKNPNKKKVSGYTIYDKSIHEISRILSDNNRIPVVLNDTNELFKKGDSPDTALYCGWYSLSKYIDAFTWQKGSVGYHIASAECTTLRKKNSQVWCKKMLDNGIAATIGPVGEPYVQAFPVPEIFFNYLTEGYLTLAESYLISLPYLSWKMVLIGDPLYRLNLKS